MQSKCFWFQHNVCSVGTSCEIGSWGYDSSMHLRKASPSRQIFKALKTRAGHDLVHDLTGKQFWALNTGKLQVSLSQMKLRLDTNQMAGVRCECGAWDLLEDIAICVFLAGDHEVWTKMNYELLGYFKSWKMNLWKCCTKYARKLGKLSSGHGTEKVSFHSMPKYVHTTKQFYSSHTLVK